MKLLLIKLSIFGMIPFQRSGKALSVLFTTYFVIRNLLHVLQFFFAIGDEIVKAIYKVQLDTTGASFQIDTYHTLNTNTLNRWGKAGVVLGVGVVFKFYLSTRGWGWGWWDSHFWVGWIAGLMAQ